MSDARTKGRALAASQDEATDPASNRQIFMAGACFLILALLVFYVLVASWPTPDGAPGGPGPAKGFQPFQLFGQKNLDWSPDQRMFLTVIAAGAVGSLIHTLTSLGDYIGNKKLSANWLWWFVLRTPIGISLALIFYLLLRGGLIVPSQNGATGSEATTQLNPYGVAGFSALAGMFSKQATDKLREVFETLFTAQKPVQRDDPLNAPLVLTIKPETLTKGQPAVLTVTGSGFQQGTRATINGSDRKFTFTSATEGTVTPITDDVATVGRLTIVIINPNRDSFTGTVDVKETS